MVVPHGERDAPARREHVPRRRTGDLLEAEQILASCPEVALVLIDMVMPVVDGVTLLERTKRQRPELWHLLNGRISPGETIRVFTTRADTLFGDPVVLPSGA